MRPSRSRAARVALPAALLAAAVSAAPASATEATIKLRVSSHWAIGGLPLYATVTASTPGKVFLSQSRLDGLVSLKGDYCGHPEPEILREITSFHVAANTPVKIGINTARLSFFEGELFPVSTCWNKATTYKELVATLGPDDATQPDVDARTALQRVL